MPWVVERSGPFQHEASLTTVILSLKRALAIPGFRITWTPEKAVVSADGTVCQTYGTNQVTVPDPDGNPMALPGRYVTTWVRRPGGAWRCSVNVWNADH